MVGFNKISLISLAFNTFDLSIRSSLYNSSSISSGNSSVPVLNALPLFA
nr:MAG TPA: hypothetical protein [Caudoviricetes sp.]